MTGSKLRRFVLYRLGYFYFALLFLFLLFLVVAVLYTRRIRPGMIGAATVLFVMAKGYFDSMRIKVPAPEGLEVTAEDAPELVQLITDVSQEVSVPKIDSVKFDSSVNAYVTEIPRWGAVGPFKRYLVLGLPLMLFLSLDEFKSVLAHEMAHLSKAHSKSWFRVQRGADVWIRVAEELKKAKREHHGLIHPFLVRYIPALTGGAFLHRREGEFEADRIAAQVAGPQVYASSLLKTRFYSSYLDNVFWSSIFQHTKSSDQPPSQVFLQMEEFCSKPVQVENADEIFERLMAFRSMPSSTHPSYAERLSNIGAQPQWPDHADQSALRALLGDRADALLERASEWWTGQASDMWTAMRRARIEMESKLGELEEKAATGANLSPEEAIDRALLIEEIEGRERGLEAFRALQSEYPDDIAVAFHTGRLMIQTGDMEGEAVLGQVVEKDPQTIPECCALLYQHYRTKGDIEQAYGYYQYALNFMYTNEQVQAERSTVRMDDEFQPHDLALAEIEAARQALEKKGFVQRAYIIRKTLELSSLFPLYILVVKLPAGTKAKRQKLMMELAESDVIPWDYYVVPIYGRNREVEYKAALLRGTRVL